VARGGPPPGDWEESTEGNLDPDLTEEAGYSGWDPPRRNWVPLLLKTGLVLALLAMLAGVLLPVLGSR
jgi:hypothetical protein